MKIEEVAMRIGVSVQTLNRWYQFKRKHPADETSKLIPEYSMRTTSRGKTRDWTEEDVWKLIAFQKTITAGRNGKMGKYGGAGTHGKTESRASGRRKKVDA